MNKLGLSERELFKIGVAAQLDAVTDYVSSVTDSIDAGSLQDPLKEGELEQYASIKAVAAMIVANNQILEEKLKKFGFPGNK
ncbi:hypothetical protein ACYCS5_26720 [Paenibacillus sp. SEL3]